jgi:hypothetical protein
LNKKIFRWNKHNGEIEIMLDPMGRTLPERPGKRPATMRFHSLRPKKRNQSKGMEEVMATQDKCVTIVPYFKVNHDELESFERLCERFVQVSESEPDTIYYGWSFNGDQAHCREGYTGAEAALVHLKDVGPLLEEALKIAELTILQVHGPEAELAKLRGPLADFKVEYFALKYGFRR